MAPHQSPLFTSTCNNTVNKQPFGNALFESSNAQAPTDYFPHWKNDSRIKDSGDLFSSLEVRVEAQPSLGFLDLKQSRAPKFSSTNILEDYYTTEPEDRFALGFAVALHTGHCAESSIPISHSNVGYLNEKLEESPWRYGIDTDVDAWEPHSGAHCVSTKQYFLSTCNFCYRDLTYHDVFMYR
jgi:hypothetical protein